MTTYIPALTLPEAIFNNPVASVLFPIALGTAVGYSTRRTHLPIPYLPLLPPLLSTDFHLQPKTQNRNISRGSSPHCVPRRGCSVQYGPFYTEQWATRLTAPYTSGHLLLTYLYELYAPPSI